MPTHASADTAIYSRRESEARSYCRSFDTVFTKASNATMWDAAGAAYTDTLKEVKSTVEEDYELTDRERHAVANACRDRFRKRRHVSSPKSVIQKLDERERLVFKYYYQEHVPRKEICDYVRGKRGLACEEIHVNRAIEKIDRLLSVNKRWHLIAALRANKPTLSLEDLAGIG